MTKPIHPDDVVNRARDQRVHDFKVGDFVQLDQPGFLKVHRIGVVTHLAPKDGTIVARFPWSANGEGEIFDPLMLLKVNVADTDLLPTVGEHVSYDDWGKQKSEERYGKAASRRRVSIKRRDYSFRDLDSPGGP